MAEATRITFRLDPVHVAKLDADRGTAERSAYIRKLIEAGPPWARRPAASSSSSPPTHAEALRLLAERAQYDAAAAIRLAELVG